MADYIGNLMKFGLVGVAAVAVNWALTTWMPQFAIGGAIGTIMTVAIGGTIAKEVKLI